MKKYLKLIFASILTAFFALGCTDDANRDWAGLNLSLTLQDPSLGSMVLYPTMKDNPFVLGWDHGNIKTANYTVYVSTSADFSGQAAIGTSTDNFLNSTVGDLNTALLAAGVSPYSSTKVYVRVAQDNGITSNTIQFTATPYPSGGPVITAPTANTALVLDSQNPNKVIQTVTWKDFADYGVPVTYTIQVAATGTTNFHPIGTVTDSTKIAVTNAVLNDAVLKAGVLPGVAGAVDLQIVATSTSVGGTITNTSNVVTMMVTPYQSVVPLFLIGDATAAGWNNNKGNLNMFPLLQGHEDGNVYTYTGYFQGGGINQGFKIVKTKGSYDVQYGLGRAPGQLSTEGDSKNILVTTSGYYQLTIDISKLTYSFNPVTAPIVSYASMGIIGDATPDGWNGDTPMTQSTFDPHMWYIGGLPLVNGAFKFRANGNWDVSWGGSDELFGTATSDNGPNTPATEGTYDVYFNDASGAYVLVKK